MQRKRLKVAVAQRAIEPGNVKVMLDRVLQTISDARAQGADAVVVGEMIWGYLLGDRWEDESFLREIEAANEEIRLASHDITVVFGSVIIDWNKVGEDGRVRKYNAALLAHDGEWVNNGSPLKFWVPKTNMPKYRMFDDERHFFPAAKLATEMGVPLSDILRPFPIRRRDGSVVCVGVGICEDFWEDEYNTKPSLIYAKAQCDFLLDISRSPWTRDKRRARERMLVNRVNDTRVPILYVASVGLENNGKNLVWFDGGSALIGSDGKFKWRAVDHEESLTILDPFASKRLSHKKPEMGIAEVYHSTLNTIRAAAGHFPRIVQGLSGGVDSAVMTALLVHALGPKKVLAINMSTRFNTGTTQMLAQECASRLEVEYRVQPIQDLVEMMVRNLEAMYGVGSVPNLVLENMQAELRMVTLSRIAAMEGGIFLNNGNKTETALGYFTLNGDGRGAFAFLADLWKGDVYALAKYINEIDPCHPIPEGIITIIPSAELSEDQNPEQGKGDPIFYPYHDKLLAAWVEWRRNPEWVLDHLFAGDLETVLGCKPGTIRRYFPTAEAFLNNLEWAWCQYTGTVFKRVTSVPIFITSRRSFGFDFRESMIMKGRYDLTDHYFALKAQVLSTPTLW